MTRKVLLDTNLLIAALDKSGTTSAEIKASATKRLAELASEPDVALFITPLIRYEVLRGINWLNEDDFHEMQEILNGFPELEITRNISELSANLYRYDSWQVCQPGAVARNLEKRKFDVFHFCSAHCNGLELCSLDTDIGRITLLHRDFEAQMSH